eukprot:jgi/Botrbrau1/20101/Bobra.0173s0005.1
MPLQVVNVGALLPEKKRRTCTGESREDQEVVPGAGAERHNTIDNSQRKPTAASPVRSRSSPADPEGEQLQEQAEICPICLSALELKDKAVVNTCMHAFCLGCLTRWVQEKRVCPMCKGRIEGYMYDIYSERQYQETVIPPSPPPSPHLPPFFAEPPWIELLGRASLIHPVMELDGHHRSGPWAPAFFHQRGPRGHRTRNYRQNRWDVMPPGQNAPSPYYYRVQQHAQQSQRAAASRAAQVHAASPQRAQAPLLHDIRVRWRQHIYEQDLWARVPPTRQREAQEHRESLQLRQWVERELRAVLQQDDVAFCCDFVMAMNTSYGLHTGHRLPDLLGNTYPAPEIRNGLRPFLGHDTEHFWHELRCFALSRVTMVTYDQIVRYARGRPPAAGVEDEPVDHFSAFNLWAARFREHPTPPLPVRGPLPHAPGGPRRPEPRYRFTLFGWPPRA